MKKEFQEIKTGVIGVGSMGQNHARVYSEISNLVGVTDIDQKQSQKIANRFGVTNYKDYRQMLAEVDAVSIAVPTIYHRKIAESVAKAGVNLLVEKPLADNVSDCSSIVQAADSAEVILAVGHVERYNPVVAYAKKAIIEQTWGDTIMMSSRRVSSFPERISDVGVIFDLAIHDIDVLCYLNNSKVKSVYAIGGSIEHPNHEDFVSILLEFKSGKKAYCEVNWLTPMKVRQISITSTKGYVNLDYISQTAENFSSKFSKLDQKNLFNSEIEVAKNKIEIIKEEPLKIELTDFLTSIRDSQTPVVSGKDGLNAVLICVAAQESLRTNKKIDINY